VTTQYTAASYNRNGVSVACTFGAAIWRITINKGRQQCSQEQGRSHSHCQIIISIIIIITIVYLVVVGDFEVGACVASAGGHEVGVDERVVGGDDVVECSVEVCLHAISQQIGEPATVVVTDEAISEHTLTLVIPQAHQLRQRLHANNNDNNNNGLRAAVTCVLIGPCCPALL